MWHQKVFVLVNFVAIAVPLAIRGNENYEDLLNMIDFGSARIVGGQVALDEQFPYQAGLLLRSVNGSSWCGGSLIDRRWVLTAAHCLIDRDNITVFLGTTRLFGTNEVGTQTMVVTSDNFFAHEEYDQTWKTNDIGLLKLPQEARITRDVKLISLPGPEHLSNTFEGTIAVASGWGRPSDDVTTVSDILRYAELEVISNFECTKFFGYLLVKSGNICTSGIMLKSPCGGDSGGPLVYEKDNKKILIGLVSYGYSAGCEKRYPAVFARVTYYLNWIQNNMKR